MKDIFQAKILCGNCDEKMLPITLEKSGFILRAIECPKCKEKIIHPQDLNSFNHYNSLKAKTYIVKLRIVGNSHAVSIPKEIVDFIHQSNRINKKMDEVVKLCFEDFGRLSLVFNERVSPQIGRLRSEELRSVARKPAAREERNILYIQRNKETKKW